jgi:cytochrome c2
VQQARRRIGWRLLAPALAALAAQPSCKQQGPMREVSGDAELGRQAIQKYGCGTCHTIPGVDGAMGRKAQPLVEFGNRGDIARAAANTLPNLIHWIQRPQELNPRTRMPNLGVTEKDARDIAAYLYSSPSK